MTVSKIAQQPITKEEFDQIVNDNDLLLFMDDKPNVQEVEVPVMEHITGDYTDNFLCYLEEAQQLDAEYLKLYFD